MLAGRSSQAAPAVATALVVKCLVKRSARSEKVVTVSEGSAAVAKALVLVRDLRP